MKKLIPSILLAATLALAPHLCPSPSWACPACMQMKMTLADELGTCQGAVLAVPVEGSANSYQVEKSLKGDVKVGRILTAAVPDSKGSKYILTTVAGPNSPFWTGKVRPADEEVVRFSKTALLLPNRFEKGSARLRLDFFTPYLGHSNRLLADSSCAEFSSVSFKLLLEYAQRLGREKLLALWQKASSDEQRALYLVMLGAFADSKELTITKPMLEAAQKGPDKPYLSALLFCHLQSQGNAALPKIESSFLKAAKPERKFASLEALRLIVNEKGRIAKSDIVPIFRRLLVDKDVAGPVIQDLALWGDWDSLTAVSQLLSLPKDQRWIRISAVRYLRTCPKPAAKQILNRLKTSEPELLKFATTPYSPPPPPVE